jgi:hypothetical protein
MGQKQWTVFPETCLDHRKPRTLCLCLHVVVAPQSPKSFENGFPGKVINKFVHPSDSAGRFFCWFNPLCEQDAKPALTEKRQSSQATVCLARFPSYRWFHTANKMYGRKLMNYKHPATRPAVNHSGFQHTTSDLTLWSWFPLPPSKTHRWINTWIVHLMHGKQEKEQIECFKASGR